MAAGTRGQDQAARLPDDDTQILDAERGVNERYRHELESMVERAPHLARSVGAVRSSSWTDSAPTTTVSRSVISPIVGRVGFEVEDPDLGRGFYVGGLWGREWTTASEQVLVVAWAAPVARLFFDGCTADDRSAALVRGRRTFGTTVDGDVRTFEDDLEPDCTSRQAVFPLPTGGAVAVPTAPRPVVRPRPPRPVTEASKPATVALPRPIDETTAGPEMREVEAPPVRSRPVSAVPAVAIDRTRVLRAPQSVRSAIDAPKTGRLGSVLATLQPDQYGIVTWPDDHPLIVQGQPGTGKTIVATHRAAFLTHPDREPQPLNRVALIGPTEAWRLHAQPSLDQLGATNVSVLSLQELLSELAGVPWHRMTQGRDERADTLWKLGRFIDDAIAAAPRRSGGGVMSVRAVVGMLADIEAVPHVRRRHPAASRWFTDAGGWSRLSSLARCLPALAAVGQALGRGREPAFDHLIVDEAQDVRPLEWKILLQLLSRRGALTLLGDVNQRRCDWTAGSWTELAVDLEITDDEGRAPVHEVQIGYRSTMRILRFANQLLPSSERQVDAIRDGSDPVVKRLPAQALERRAVDAARTLAAKYKPGLAAIISTNPQPLSDYFRRLGWKRPPELRDAWREDGKTVVILHPDRARGLEFDAVVVVEPSSFPENVGRAGSLYTSLTRATKDLMVLHSRALPRGLRPPRRRHRGH
jgi:hypothetical protein